MKTLFATWCIICSKETSMQQAIFANKTNSSLSNIIQAGIDSLGKTNWICRGTHDTIQYWTFGYGIQDRVHFDCFGSCPRLGFMGTILGVITIFHGISQTADISIGTISRGLYQKMISSVVLSSVQSPLQFYNFYWLKVDTFHFTCRKKYLNLLKESINLLKYVRVLRFRKGESSMMKIPWRRWMTSCSSWCCSFDHFHAGKSQCD